MEIATMIICCLVCLIVNFFLVVFAIGVALKAMSKTLIAIIDECEEADTKATFWKAFKNHND